MSIQKITPRKIIVALEENRIKEMKLYRLRQELDLDFSQQPPQIIKSPEYDMFIREDKKYNEWLDTEIK